MNNLNLRICGIAAGLMLLSTQSLFAFGTVRGLGQNAEHERITRHALACGLFSDEFCFQEKTLNELAGSKDNFGAIGIPDRGELVPVNKAHCDSGDYLDIPDYPHSKMDAEAALEKCRAWIQKKLHDAVSDAAGLVGESGHLRASQMDMPCLFVGQIKGHAKCNVFEDLGILLHTSQDFYSHTNWADVADPTQPIGVENPPGLGNTTRAPWLDLRNDNPVFPDGLISGCFEKPPEKTHCNYGPGKSLHRVKHAVVNKDEGAIDPVRGDGTTLRGRHDGNFARAVTAAIDDTQDKWLMFRQMLVQTYGAKSGALMACAISHDAPTEDCR
jgi:hypothetical protein